MFGTMKDFLNDWRNERESTRKVLTALSDASLSRRVHDDGRTLGFIAWHLVLTLGEMGGKAGLAIKAPAENSPVPDNVREIASAYADASLSLSEELSKKWDDKMLAGEIEMYGEKWTRAQTLAAMMKHEIHHRAQMTVLMRQAGLKVPGLYGPAREEWAEYGMQPME